MDGDILEIEEQMPSKALIVEDEIFVALDLERILASVGYSEVAIAADRATALAAADNAEIAFVDVNLRDGPTGPDVAATIHREHGIPVVFVTANPTQIVDPDGAYGYVQKPFTDLAIVHAAKLATGASCEAYEDVVPFNRA